LPRDRQWLRASVEEWKEMWASGRLKPEQREAAVRLLRNIDDLNASDGPKERRKLSQVVRLERNDLLGRGQTKTRSEKRDAYPTMEEWNAKSRAFCRRVAAKRRRTGKDELTLAREELEPLYRDLAARPQVV
jgi:hypothetical protein